MLAKCLYLACLLQCLLSGAIAQEVDSLSLSAERPCISRLTGVYVKKGRTGSGAPWYQSDDGSHMIHYDLDCSRGRGVEPRWIISSSRAISTDASSDIDGDGRCVYLGRLSSNSNRVPSGTQNWTFACGPKTWTRIPMTLAFQAAGRKMGASAHAHENKERMKLSEIQELEFGSKAFPFVSHGLAIQEGLLAVLIFIIAVASNIYGARQTQKKTGSFCQNYGELREKEKLPRVTVFECIGLLQVYEEHCSDLQHQMDRLAQDHATLLGETLGASVHEDRLERLKLLLSDKIRAAENESLIGENSSKSLKKFMEFRDGSPLTRMGWLKLYALAPVISLVQTVGLFCMIYSRYLASNSLQKRYVSLQNFVVVLLVNMLIFHLYCESSNFNPLAPRTAGAGARLKATGVGAYWTFLGDLTFLLSTLVAVAAANIVVWTQEEMLHALAYSALILVVYGLGQIALAIFVVSPEEFRDWAIKTSSLLGYCPQTIADLTDHTPSSPDKNIWQISTNSEDKFVQYPSTSDACRTRTWPSGTRFLQPLEELLGWFLIIATFITPGVMLIWWRP